MQNDSVELSAIETIFITLALIAIFVFITESSVHLKLWIFEFTIGNKKTKEKQ